jgi:hypothetical protein
MTTIDHMVAGVVEFVLIVAVMVMLARAGWHWWHARKEECLFWIVAAAAAEAVIFALRRHGAI